MSQRQADPGHRDDDPADAGGGSWLTYRYRLGGDGTPGRTGTIKAPSFGAAARRILARGLAADVGSAPAYLRLRAAGEDEVLFRVERTGPGGADALRVAAVPSDAYGFAEADPSARPRGGP